ncbi:probable protein transport Sec1b [Zingiber officinale]|uniref:probable protein transport Sec1b n=1 Tax=Zingiber officinale TaxID=94328 RepID=UPI001C4DC7E2|nr:probable protein transport Sec1b [Zingiber officinale]XP_042407570.1 probable protein transport Sec1b [Zingiber officinale]
MSMSEWDFAHANADHKFFRQISRERILNEMLRSSETKSSTTPWKILIMDKFTLKVMSFSCKMADITNQEISLVEDIFKRREPLPSMDAIYFIQPLKENVIMLLSDMSGRCPLYRKAYVFFSSPIPKELIAYIKNDTSLLPRIGALSEMNLEYFAIDNQAFTTDHEMAFEELFGETAQNSRKFNECLTTMATRVATAIASLKELPYVRYQVSKSMDESDTKNMRDLVPSKLATAVWDILSKYKSSVPDFPQKETCELLIVDRTIDQIAPYIHEWTYDAMCHDLLEMDGNKYIYEAPAKPGATAEKKEALLEDNDPIWLELRYAHIADASERLHEKMSTFKSKNKAAQHQTSRDGGEISTKDLQKIVQALPQYNEQVEKLSLHVEIAGKINRLIREMHLRDIGQLEQDLVFGDAGAKEVITLLRTKQDASPESKLRLLMIYAATYPEKFEGDNGIKLMQLAKLSPEDMKAVNNLMYFGKIDPKKKSDGNFSLKFDVQKKKQAARKEKSGEEETWALSRFYPVVEELIEKLNKGELPKDDFPYINEPVAATQATASNGTQPVQSRRSRRTATWAKGRCSDDGYSSDSVLRNASVDFKNMGQRIFIFMIGGATRSELRAVHKLTTKLRREIILGCTSLDDPPMFITRLKMLKGPDLP